MISVEHTLRVFLYSMALSSATSEDAAGVGIDSLNGSMNPSRRVDCRFFKPKTTLPASPPALPEPPDSRLFDDDN